jgi:HlyD family secretion protein
LAFALPESGSKRASEPKPVRRHDASGSEPGSPEKFSSRKLSDVTRRTWLVIAPLPLLVAGGAIWWWSSRPPPSIVWQGYAEADFVMVGPTQQGLLTAVLVARGDAVATGAPLFTQDDVDDRAARDQAAQMLAQAARQLVNLEAGAKPTEIEQAEDNLADAQATLVRTAADLGRGEVLLPKGDTTKQAVDQLRADQLSAQAKVEALQSALMQSRGPLGRVGEIEAQRATVAAARATLDMAEWRLGQRRVAAPAAGRVADVIARPGETMAAGAPVVSMLPPGNIFVRFFVPESDLATIHGGDRVRLACDGCPADLSATISFISPQAEYTPPLIYSESSKSKLVFLIEARPPPDQAATLNPGEPMEVRPQGTHPPQATTKPAGARTP